MLSPLRHPSLAAVLERPFAVMGVLNITPDSFYDGGRYDAPEAAVAQAGKMADEGADIIDIGGESSKPGAVPVDTETEIRRVLPVIEAVRKASQLPISIDTTKAEVARRALDAGVAWVNDISGGRFDPGMAPLVAQRGCPVVVMHSREVPLTMQQAPQYGNTLTEVEDELAAAVQRFLDSGVSRLNIVIDPGIGFAKRLEDNLAVLRGLPRLCGLGFPLLVGTSRKSFVGLLTGKGPQDRLAGSLGSVAAAYMRGARLFRVHDVGATVDMLKVLAAIEGSQSGETACG